MLKRKRGERPELGRFGLSLAIGVVMLVVLSLVGMVLLLTIRRPAETPVALMRTTTPPPYPTRTPIPFRTNTPLPSQTWVPMPTGLPLLPVGGSLVYSTNSHDIGSFDGDGMHSLPPKGNDVTASPDGQALAYIRDGQLYVYRGGEETPVNTSHLVAKTPVWNSDGTALIFTTWRDPDTVVLRRDRSTGQVTELLSVHQLTAPPQPVPGVHRLLIAENVVPDGTVLYTIDEFCSTLAMCQKSRQDVATIHQYVIWAVYHPSGIYIFFIDNTDCLFALKTSTQEVISLLSNGISRRLATGRDPGKLAYTDANNNLYLFDLDSGVSQRLLPTAVTSVSWTGGG